MRAPALDRVVVACPSSVAKEWIPAVLRDAVAHHPHLRFDVLTNEPVRGERSTPPDLDVTVVPGGETQSDGRTHTGGGSSDGGAPRAGQAHPGAGELLAVDPYQLVVRRDHPAATQQTVRVADLRDLSLLDLDVEGSVSGDVMDDAARAAGITPHHVARADDHYGLLAMVMAGIGVAPLPRLAALDLPPSLVAVPLVDPEPVRSIVLHSDPAAQHHPHMTDIRAAFRRAALRSSSTASGVTIH